MNTNHSKIKGYTKIHNTNHLSLITMHFLRKQYETCTSCLTNSRPAASLHLNVAQGARLHMSECGPAHARDGISVSAILAVRRCLSVCPSRSCIVSKLLAF